LLGKKLNALSILDKIIKRMILMRLVATIFLLLILFSPLQADSDLVYLIPVHGVIDLGMASFVRRAVREAHESKAQIIIIEIDTPGGRIDAALDISDTLLKSEIPLISFIKEATSAGVLIAISAKDIVMTPTGTIGAAQPWPKDEKVISFWTSKLRVVAQARGRDPTLVAAMADADIEIEGVIERGKLLSLTAQEALRLNLADKILGSRKEVLAYYTKQAQMIVLHPAYVERLASFVTGPIVSSILLSIGFWAMVAEIFTVGWGVAGIIGLASFALFFWGHLIAGLVGWEVFLLFGLGIALLIGEFFVPGGILGLLGIGGIAASIILASPSPQQGIIYLSVAFLSSVVMALILFKVFGKSRLFGRIILATSEKAGLGYTAPPKQLDLLGKKGKTITPLRPAGIAEFEGRRVDVVSEGEFIPQDTSVKVIKVEGGRVVVRMF
jgi:membrane-bound serine protease (ClpP class)